MRVEYGLVEGAGGFACGERRISGFVRGGGSPLGGVENVLEPGSEQSVNESLEGLFHACRGLEETLEKVEDTGLGRAQQRGEEGASVRIA